MIMIDLKRTAAAAALGLAASMAAGAASAWPATSAGWQTLNGVSLSECITRARAAYATLSYQNIANGDRFAKGQKGDYASYTVCNAFDGNVYVNIFVAFSGQDTDASIVNAERVRLQNEMEKSVR